MIVAMSVSQQYTEEIKKHVDYSATWLPNTIVHLGDVGRLVAPAGAGILKKKYEFTYETTLKKLGIDFDTEVSATNMDWDYSSANSVSINAKASGQAAIPGSSLTPADAGFTIKFSRDKAIVFRLLKCTATRISDLTALKNTILSLHNQQKWEDDMVVVTEVVKANSATIIISNSSDSQIDLAAKGNAKVGTFDLADVDANFQIVTKKNIATDFIATGGLTPLFKGIGILSTLLRGPGIADVLSPSTGKPEIGVGRVDYGNFR
jgi:hypothetical protein